jgi:hypothetical protein
MSNLLEKNPHIENEIDLREIFKILIDAKKLIISTTLILVIASIIIFVFQKPLIKTSTLLEIGYIENVDGGQDLIEVSKNLLSNLRVVALKNEDNRFNQTILISRVEDKLIKLVTTSNSEKLNENALTEMINYIVERHSKFSTIKLEKKKNLIHMKIKSIESELSFVKSKLSEKNQSSIIAMIVDLNQRRTALKYELDELNNLIVIQTSPIRTMQVSNLNKKIDFFIKYALIIGLITGVLLAFISKSVKNLIGSQA